MKRLLKILVGLAVLLLVALVVNDVLARRETQPARADGGRLVSVLKTQIHVREGGRRGAPPIVLIHGFGASSHWWDRAVPALGRRHRVILVDLLGHGGSAKPTTGYSMENQARLVGAVLRGLHVRNAIVAGHSMGGNVAVALAEGNPRLVRGIVLVGTGARAQDGRDLGLTARLGFYPLVGPAVTRLVTEGQLREIMGKVAFAPGTPVPERFVRDFQGLTYSAYNESGSSSADYVKHQSLDRRLEALRRPVLVLFGPQDQTVKPGAWNAYRKVPRATVRLVAGTGHSPMWEKPAVTNRHLLAFARP